MKFIYLYRCKNIMNKINNYTGETHHQRSKKYKHMRYFYPTICELNLTSRIYQLYYNMNPKVYDYMSFSDYIFKIFHSKLRPIKDKILRV